MLSLIERIRPTAPSMQGSVTKRGLCVPIPARIVKIFELAFLLEVTPPIIAALHLVFRSPVTDTHRQ